MIENIRFQIIQTWGSKNEFSYRKFVFYDEFNNPLPE